MSSDDTRDADREETLQQDVEHAVEVGDDDALAGLVERLRELRFLEVRRVLDGLDTHQLRRVAETAIALARSQP